ncbi:DUF115 domain-containing protein [Synechococcus sp. AH-601-N10]|nr:DUF115 domain-containing protein [Synechococcus sp. AH-601-N10]
MSSINFSQTNLIDGLEALGGLNHPFLRETHNAFESLEYSNESHSILDNGKSVIENINNLTYKFQHEISNQTRMLMPRLSNEASNVHLSATQCLHKCLDSDGALITACLETANSINMQPSPEWSKTLILLGAALLPAIDYEKIKRFTHIYLFESSPRDLAIGLSLCHFDHITNMFKSCKQQFNIILDQDPVALREKARAQLVGLNLTSCYGMSICSSDISNPKLNLLKSWMTSPEGLSQAVMGALGGEVDEINQLIQAIYTAQKYPERLLVTPQSDLHDKSVVLVASGPSLDNSIDWLSKHQSDLQIVAAGSSLGTLLRKNITPSAAVFLERSSIVFEKDLTEVVNEGFDLSDIPLIASMSLDPRILDLFGHKIWFHRPLSTTLAFFPDEAEGKLLQSGPHSANAALEALLHLGHREILLLGCDFSAKTRSIPRASNALGESPRNFNVPVRGRAGKTVFSNPELIDASAYFENAAACYGANLYSTMDGIDMPRANLELIECNNDIANQFLNRTPLDMSWLNSKVVTLNSQSIINRIDLLENQLTDSIVKIGHIIENTSNWDINLANKVNSYLSLDETGLSAEKALIKRMMRFPLSILFMNLHDSSYDSWENAKIYSSKNLAWLEAFYLNYLNLLKKLSINPPICFDWQAIKLLSSQI